MHTHTHTCIHAQRETIAKIYTIDRRVHSHYIYIQSLWEAVWSMGKGQGLP